MQRDEGQRHRQTETARVDDFEWGHETRGNGDLCLPDNIDETVRADQPPIVSSFSARSVTSSYLTGVESHLQLVLSLTSN